MYLLVNMKLLNPFKAEKEKDIFKNLFVMSSATAFSTNSVWFNSGSNYSTVTLDKSKLFKEKFSVLLKNLSEYMDSLFKQSIFYSFILLLTSPVE